MTPLSEHSVLERSETTTGETPPTPPAPSEVPALSLRDVRITNRVTGEEIVHGVAFELSRGRVVGIVGESGSGKTLTCRAALGILPPRIELTGG